MSESYNFNTSLKLALEDGQVLCERLRELTNEMGSKDPHIREVFWMWRRWEESMITHLTPEHSKVFIGLRAHLGQRIFTRPKLRLDLADCIEKQICDVRDLQDQDR